MTVRFLLAIPALIFAVGASIHGGVAPVAATRINSSNLSPLLAAQLKALWIADSTTLFALAFVFAALAISPSSASRRLILLLAIPTAAESVVVFYFLGSFFAGYLLSVASVCIIIAGLIKPSSEATSPTV